MAKNRILAIGDTHYPFTCRRSLNRVLDLADELKPTVILQMGDLYDMFSFSKYPRSHNVMMPEKELDLGLEQACDMWRELKKRAPRAKKFQLIGNHDVRPIKRMMEVIPALESFLDLRKLFDFPGVEMAGDDRDELFIDDICFMHGYRSKLGDHMRHNRMKTVCGHAHRGGVVYERLGDKILWELNTGFIGDVSSVPMSYSRQRKLAQYTKGVGFIDPLGPRFIPIEVKS